MVIGNIFNLAGGVDRAKQAQLTMGQAIVPFSGGVQSNTGVNKVDSVLSAVASHPFLTAGAVATATTSAGRAGAISVAKFVFKNPLASTFGLLGGLVTIKSTKAKEAVADLPKATDNFTTNVAKAIDKPTVENAKKIVKENPFIAGGIVLGSAFLLGKAGSALYSSLATMGNTNALKDNTKATATAKASEIEKTLQTKAPAIIPDMPKQEVIAPAGTPNLVAPVSTNSPQTRSVVAGATRRRRKPKQQQAINIKVNNNITDDRDVYDRKVYK